MPTRPSLPDAHFQTAFTSLATMRILLVEDHAELSRWVAKALQDARLTVECAINGNDAVTLHCGALSFDSVSRMFSYGGANLALTPREHAVLEALMHRAGRAVS